jgi:hypothetical protein
MSAVFWAHLPPCDIRARVVAIKTWLVSSLKIIWELFPAQDPSRVTQDVSTKQQWQAVRRKVVETCNTKISCIQTQTQESLPGSSEF